MLGRISSSILTLSLLASSAYGDGFGFNIGPFNMQFGASSDSYMTSNRNVLDNPICSAISYQKRLEIILEGAENVSTKEKKIVTKRLVVEPYAFGVTKEGKPVLRGNIVEEKLITEVTLKYGDEQFDESSVPSKEKEKSFFSGLFTSDKNVNIDIRKIVQVQVIDDSHFDAPKDYKGLKDSNIHVICELPVAQ